MAIGLRIKQDVENIEPNASKLLGSPVLPEGWLEKLDPSVIFLLQVNLSDIKDLDKDNVLPHEGYLYFFLDTVEGEYDLKPIVRYFKGEPLEVVENFNEVVDGYEEYVKEYPVEFFECEDDASGTRLLGVPADWNYAEEPRRLLLQFDPLDPGLGIFENIDGLFYFFFKEGVKEPFKTSNVKVELQEEYS